MIHFVMSEPHYAAHALPVMAELFKRGIEVECHDGTGPLADDETPTVIAAMSEQAAVPQSRPLCLVDHGVGQNYANMDHQSYNGGRNRERVSLFLYGATCGIEANQSRYPDATHVHVGPVTLDKWARPTARVFTRLQHLSPEAKQWGGFIDSRAAAAPPTVAFAWHWNLTVTQETQSAFAYYLPVLERLAADSAYTLLGHAHPRMWGSVEGHYDRLGIEIVRDPNEVMARADLVCFDNTSFGYECAAVGVPVLALDAPHYRDTPRQSPRFYDDVPGLRLRAYRDQAPECGMVQAGWGRDNLGPAVEEALEDRASLREWRQRVVRRVYGEGMLDGRAAERAAEAVIQWGMALPETLAIG